MQEAKELGSVSRPWRRGYSVPNLNLGLNGTSVSGSNIQRPSGEELMNLRLRKVNLLIKWSMIQLRNCYSRRKNFSFCRWQWIV
jgi:hypothetical protein